MKISRQRLALLGTGETARKALEHYRHTHQILAFVDPLNEQIGNRIHDIIVLPFESLMETQAYDLVVLAEQPVVELYRRLALELLIPTDKIALYPNVKLDINV